MKIDKDIKELFERTDNLANANERETLSTTTVYDDDYYIAIGAMPPRFQVYRRARWEKLDEWGKLTCEDVDKTITQDELDFMLKRDLSKTPEQRYQEEKANRFFHELGSYMRGLSVDDYDQGCHDLQCIPECPFYPEYGRIEDEEVIEDHNERVECFSICLIIARNR